jgi:hypothetical protein
VEKLWGSVKHSLTGPKLSWCKMRRGKATSPPASPAGPDTGRIECAVKEKEGSGCNACIQTSSVTGVSPENAGGGDFNQNRAHRKHKDQQSVPSSSLSDLSLVLATIICSQEIDGGASGHPCGGGRPDSARRGPARTQYGNKSFYLTPFRTCRKTWVYDCTEIPLSTLPL